MEALSFRHISPQLSFQKYFGLYFNGFSLKKVITYNILADVEYLTSLLVHSNYFLVCSLAEQSAVVSMYYLMMQSIAKTM
jgi:hypothetical protein